MGAFIAYTIKCFFCLAFAYLFHKLLLGRETFHGANRITWLLLIPCSLLLPLCAPELWGFSKNTIDFSAQMSAYLSDATVAVPMPESGAGMSWFFRGGAVVYLAGVLFFAVRIGYGYVGMMFLVASRQKITMFSPPDATEVKKTASALLVKNKQILGIERNVCVILRPDNPTPFSWLNYIVIGEADLMESGDEILRHELSHIRKRHTLDVMLADLLLIYQWFNPAAWLLKRSLQQVHEFQADEAVLQSGVNAKHYQLLLVKKAVGRRLFSMANNFNYSKLKNRIAMMLKEKSSKWAYVKYLYILPLAFAFVSVYASEPVIVRMNRIENCFAVIPDTFSAPEDTVSLKIRILGEANPAYILDEASVPGSEKEDILVTPGNTSKVTIRGIASDERLPDEELPLYICDGKEVSSIEHISPNDIASIAVLKDEKAMSIYGEKGKNGVIVIVSKEKKRLDGKTK